MICRKNHLLLTLGLPCAALDIGRDGGWHTADNKILTHEFRQFLMNRIRHIISELETSEPRDLPGFSKCQQKFLKIKRRHIHILNASNGHREVLPSLLARFPVQHEFKKRPCGNNMQVRTLLIEIAERF